MPYRSSATSRRGSGSRSSRPVRRNADGDDLLVRRAARTDEIGVVGVGETVGARFVSATTACSSKTRARSLRSRQCRRSCNRVGPLDVGRGVPAAVRRIESSTSSRATVSARNCAPCTPRNGSRGAGCAGRSESLPRGVRRGGTRPGSNCGRRDAPADARAARAGRRGCRPRTGPAARDRRRARVADSGSASKRRAACRCGSRCRSRNGAGG